MKRVFVFSVLSSIAIRTIYAVDQTPCERTCEEHTALCNYGEKVESATELQVRIHPLHIGGTRPGFRSKFAPRFDLARPIDEVRYPAHIITDEHIIEHLKKWNIYPRHDCLIDWCRVIPYTSNKRNYQSKTGRDKFRVIQYTFEKDDKKDKKEWVVMWDYNFGMVRVTPFFQCMAESHKTDPRKAIQATPGLMDLCHSITGGSVIAQGYWVPFEAARALATTFCYSIRHPLSLIFGPNFINECIHPSNPNFKNWKIPTEIVDMCKENLRSWASSSNQETSDNAACGGGGTRVRKRVLDIDDYTLVGHIDIDNGGRHDKRIKGQFEPDELEAADALLAFSTDWVATSVFDSSDDCSNGPETTSAETAAGTAPTKSSDDDEDCADTDMTARSTSLVVSAAAATGAASTPASSADTCGIHTDAYMPLSSAAAMTASTTDETSPSNCISYG